MTREEQLKIADLFFCGDLEIVTSRFAADRDDGGSQIFAHVFDRLLGRFYLIEYVELHSAPVRTISRDSIKVVPVRTASIGSPTVIA